MQKFPIGIQSFEKIRTENYLYVDKTAYLHHLVTSGVYYFLSRPRRFGKSLLISTLEAYFQGKKELFEGLAVAEKETDWNAYPILHLDLNTENYGSVETLMNKLNVSLTEWEELYGRNPAEQSAGTRFEGIIKRACRKEKKRVVILIDEYDKPLLAAIGNEELQKNLRNELKAFYGALKSCDAYIHFALLTGVTKFGKVSVFSDLNNLMDISMLPQYASICGITEEEIRHGLHNEVQALAEANGLAEEACYERLKNDYDGYHFCPNTVGLYNPFSLLSTLKNKVFDDYWFETGTPSFLVEQLKKTEYNLEYLTQEEISTDTINSIDTIDWSPLPLLYQSGYLTIKEYDSVYDLYKLGFPNQEVEKGFIKYLLPYYTPKPQNPTTFVIRNFVREVESGKPEDFLNRMEAFLADSSYQIAGDAELYFHNTLYIFFKILGFYVQVERPTSDGRMDAVIQTKDYVYVIEIKIDKSPEEALRQIEDKQYAKPFAADPRKLFKIGINFSTKTRRMDGWKVQY